MSLAVELCLGSIEEQNLDGGAKFRWGRKNCKCGATFGKVNRNHSCTATHSSKIVAQNIAIEFNVCAINVYRFLHLVI